MFDLLNCGLFSITSLKLLYSTTFSPSFDICLIDLKLVKEFFLLKFSFHFNLYL